MKKQASALLCPCGSGAAHINCCGPLLAGEAAPTAERLMRSRYSAYVLQRESYLLATWHDGTCPSDLGFDEPQPKWLGLEVKRHETSGDEAVVEFIARFKTGGRAGRLHEISRFVREGGRWFYVAGEFPGG
jgi:SEC-C motif-containing protein